MNPCADLLTCPVCERRLAADDRSLRCARGHSFDRAREGYVHLLPAGHGRSKLEGDASAMVRSRRAFLDRGHYERLSDAISVAATRALGPVRGRPRVVVESGCGEGYYIGRLAEAASSGDTRTTGCFFGVDLSKEAVRHAARRYPAVEFLVNDVNHRICLADAGADLLLDVFAPRNAAEFARVLRPGGSLLVVIPGPDHLQELRERLPLLGIETDKRQTTVAGLEGPFTLRWDAPVVFTIQLESAAIIELLRMTPNYWHLGQAELEAVGGWSAVEVTVSARLLLFERRDGDEPGR